MEPNILYESLMSMFLNCRLGKSRLEYSNFEIYAQYKLYLGFFLALQASFCSYGLPYSVVFQKAIDQIVLFASLTEHARFEL